jgi:CheY-like chemotaxis protein
MAARTLKRILLVEDDPDIQVVAALALTRLGGFVVRVCGSGPEAIAAAPAFRPHLILLDVMMPGTDGPTTLVALRRIPETAATPVVFMTAKVQPHEIEEYERAGCASVIAKPFEPSALPETLKEVWGRLHDETD